MKKYLIVLTGLVCAPSFAGEIAQLYAPQPPAGSSFVRVVNPLEQQRRVRLAGKEDVLSAATRIASDYRVLDAAKAFVLEAGEKAGKLNEIKVAPDGFFTIVLTADKPGYVVLSDSTDERDDGLRAELRFYNTVPGCAGGVSLKDGPAVFDKVATGTTVKRVINPVKATLVGRCDAAQAAAPFTLPPLKPGDRYSLFLVGTAQMSRLVGQIDATEQIRR
jgi:hypothetical protein